MEFSLMKILLNCGGFPLKHSVYIYCLPSQSVASCGVRMYVSTVPCIDACTVVCLFIALILKG